nr:immunoglobulin light chain junction region [Macaca mulatta]MOY00496.1 immunoglobulin light chain junction region [Macaca mulatta]MOY00925.1 immunoglobulin light chain junction region [Macaca mulatta]MOY02597.1 immunoglobulin light chain junction region [Macaca mulatta]MOY04212.1 immunoglobulin light chain junction region [Macaca mulatta]
CGQGTSVPWTF